MGAVLSCLQAAVRQFLLLILLGLIMAFAVAMLTHAFTWDLPWLLRSGDYILATQHLPKFDIFSWTLAHKPWMVYQWLFNILVSLGNRLLGLDLLIRIFTLAMVFTFVGFPLLGGAPRKMPFILIILPAALALYAASGNMELRPALFTPVFLLAQLGIIRLRHAGKLSLLSATLLIAGIYVLWGNIHMELLLGFLSLGLMAVGDWLESKGWYRFSPMDPTVETPPLRFREYVVLGVVGILASLINPYGIGFYTNIVQISSEKYLNTLINELRPPMFQMFSVQCFLVLAALFALVLTRAKRAFPTSEILLLLTFTVLSLSANRFMLGACLYFAVLLPKGLYQYGLASQEKFPKIASEILRFNTYRPMFLGVLSTALLLFLVTPQFLPPMRYGNCEPLMSGVRLYGEKLRQPGDRLLNDPGIGGCLLWHYPQAGVFIDTRLHFYGSAFTKAMIDAEAMRPGWQAFLEQWQINTIFLPRSEALGQYLKRQGVYKTLYEDEFVIILRKQKQR